LHRRAGDIKYDLLGSDPHGGDEMESDPISVAIEARANDLTADALDNIEDAPLYREHARRIGEAETLRVPSVFLRETGLHRA
jgi:hypothetical protein